MKALLLVAHGSRREASNNEVRVLTEKLASQKHGFGWIHCAFLELAEPSIPDGLYAAITEGAEHIVVLPYFLSAGRHVTEDIPAEIAVVQQKFPDIEIHMAAYLGASEKIAETLLEQALTTECKIS